VTTSKVDQLYFEIQVNFAVPLYEDIDPFTIWCNCCDCEQSKWGCDHLYCRCPYDSKESSD